MKTRDWSPGDDVAPQEKNRIDKIAERILVDDKLKQILALYTEGLAIKASEIDKTNIDEKIVKFLTKFKDAKTFRLQGDARKLYRYTDDEAIEKFEETVYGPRMKAEGLETMMTQEFTVPAQPDFKLRSELKPSETKQVEFKRDPLKICKEIYDDPQLKNELKFILAGFTDFKEGRDAIDLTNLSGLVNKFLARYDNLDQFEKEGNVKHFLETLQAGKEGKDKQANKDKQDKYSKVMMRFEDIMFGHHKER